MSTSQVERAMSEIAAATAEHAWQAITQMTETMQGYAEQEQWDALVTLDAERRQAMTQFFSDFNREQHAELLADGIPKVLAMDNIIITHCEKKSEALKKQFCRNRQQCKAVKHYL